MPNANLNLTPAQVDVLIDKLVSLGSRPWDFVMWAWPWGEVGTVLEGRWPEAWQERAWRDIQEALVAGDAPEATRLFLIAIKSGHEVGKSAWLAMTAWWLYSTRVDTRGRMTANTEKQLRTVLWAEMAKWHGLFMAKDLFVVTATSIYSTDSQHSLNWRIDAMPWSADNPDAFSGFHNHGKRLFQIFDEASGIDDAIWERTDGITRAADTQIFWIATSNPTKNFGRFYDCFDKFKSPSNTFTGGWRTYTVSSLDVGLANKDRLNEAIAQWGEDDDYTRVRILGEFPTTSFTQLIPVEAINEAQQRKPVSFATDALILAVDIARFGNNENVAVFRRGRDARSLPCHRWRGLTVPESAARIANLIATYAPDATFIDEGGVGGGVVDNVRQLGHSCIGVNFGGSASGPVKGTRVANKRAEMYWSLLEWLRTGGTIDASLDLKDQLISIEYRFNKKEEILLMSKEDMRALSRPSPDWADALAMTFALPVAARGWRAANQIKVDYDPLALDRLPGEKELARVGGWN